MTVVFSLSVNILPLREKDKRLMEAFCWERLTGGETGSYSDGWAKLSKSFVQFSVDGQGYVPSLFFDLHTKCM